MPAEARAEALATARSAVALLETHTDACFAMSQAVVYRWLCEDDPALFERIASLAGSGRWEAVGGWWVEPDLWAASPASIRKQGEVGQDAFDRLLGQPCTVAFAPDTFGHPAWLPDVLVQAGLSAYVITRPGPADGTAPALPPLFRWHGPGGGAVTVIRPERYAGGPAADPSGLCLYGVGNHGGGPTRAHLAASDELVASGQARHGRIADAVAAASDSLEDLPNIEGDLVHHARGCYSALVSFKERMRALEHRMLQLDVAASTWEPVLFWQFHDVLAGTSAPEVYEEALADLHRLEQALADPPALHTTSTTFVPRHSVDEGRPLRLHETLGEPWDGWIPVRLVVSACASGIRVASPDADAVLLRVEQHGVAYRLDVLVRVRLEAWEERIVSWSVVPGVPPAPRPAPAGVRLDVVDDPGDTWGHGHDSFGAEVSPSPATRLWLTGGPAGLVEVTGDWYERRRALKLVVAGAGRGLALAGDGEQPGGDWSGPVWGRVWSYDVAGNHLRITLRRSPPYAQHDPLGREPGIEAVWQEQGPIRARLWLEPQPVRPPPTVRPV